MYILTAETCNIVWDTVLDVFGLLGLGPGEHEDEEGKKGKTCSVPYNI